MLLRGLSRHWWRILLLWLVISIPLAYAIHNLIEPTYEAFSILQVEPAQPQLFGPLHPGSDLAQPYVQTQVQLITSEKVLDAAISTNPRIAKLPMVRESRDAKADLRKAMAVEIVDRNTYLIRVALTSRNAEEAAEIVNAVVAAYLEQLGDYHRSANKTLHTMLNNELTKLNLEIEAKKTELGNLVQDGHVAFTKLKLNSSPSKEDETQSQTAFSNVTQDIYNSTAHTLLLTEMEILKAQAELETAQSQLALAIAAQEEAKAQGETDRLLSRTVEEFEKDPDTISLIGDINNAKKSMENARIIARQPNEPSLVAAHKHYKSLMEEWENLWAQKKPKIEAKLTAEGQVKLPDAWQGKVTDLQIRIDKMKRKKANLVDRIDHLNVDQKVTKSDTFKATLLKQELDTKLRMQEIVQMKLEQLNFEDKQDVFRISLHDAAGVPKVPSNNKRSRLAVSATMVILALMLGLFLMVEILAQRVGDPDSLSSRVQSEVYALPPLPTARSIRKRSASESDDQIEQFIQRLDHLRFAVCGNPAELEKGRCVLITSAIGREGKTTLAAQLAARCGNAGMSTLLIDADLRRTGLCSLLDIPEGTGLSDVLDNDDLSAIDLVIPVQGGTFHLLSAGTPIPDPSPRAPETETRTGDRPITSDLRPRHHRLPPGPPGSRCPHPRPMGRWCGPRGAVRHQPLPPGRTSPTPTRRRRDLYPRDGHQRHAELRLVLW